MVVVVVLVAVAAVVKATQGFVCRRVSSLFVVLKLHSVAADLMALLAVGVSLAHASRPSNVRRRCLH